MVICYKTISTQSVARFAKCAEISSDYEKDEKNKLREFLPKCRKRRQCGLTPVSCQDRAHSLAEFPVHLLSLCLAWGLGAPDPLRTGDTQRSDAMTQQENTRPEEKAGWGMVPPASVLLATGVT